MILPSNSSMRYFPENTTTCFTTELPQRIELQGRWEVALTEIQFPCSFLHIRDNEGIIRFIDIDENNKSVKAMRSQVPVGIYSSMRNIVAGVNFAAKSVDSHIVFHYGIFVGGKVFMKLNCKENGCNIIHYISFSDKLRRILGFDIHIKRNDLVQLDSEPAVPTSLPAWFYHEIGMKIQYNDDDEKLVKIESSSVIPNILPSWVYDEEMHSLLFYELTSTRMLIADEPGSLLRGIPDKLFVYCDICEPYITGDVQTPLLRIVALDSQNDYAFASTRIKHFSPAQYITLRQTCFRTIEIDIRDHLGQSIPFEFGTLTVTLHFRRI